ncbi:LytR/AlgR family response regulator transcription factor [Aliiglaciecola sp. M165]|uniref:LytR/AlgR family response regulator transcription factor n=1 Tax=Aliiglaciecola sp. M165 TaxID=2593649 RepID=UPI001180DBDD|nr:response regulator [Aliiglaciecola sp. M165]TRY31472.1 response regulator [Aliiglaciecola sp. M165]
MDTITVIIVDDEPLAREGLALRLKEVADFKVMAQCENGQRALEAITQFQPDVMFLDIEMPGLSGIELMALLHKNSDSVPKVVFVTAFKDFAVKAFEYKAFDYLLKPLSEQRLRTCLDNLRHAFLQHDALDKQDRLNQLLSRKTGKSLDGFMQSLEQGPQSNLNDLQHTISLKSGSEWLRIKIDSISWIEAAGDYMCVHTHEGTHIVRKTLRQFEQELDKSAFPRINRSTIVNLSKVTRLTPNSNGEYIAKLSSGDEVKVSRKYKLKLDELNGGVV